MLFKPSKPIFMSPMNYAGERTCTFHYPTISDLQLIERAKTINKLTTNPMGFKIPPVHQRTTPVRDLLHGG